MNMPKTVTDIINKKKDIVLVINKINIQKLKDSRYGDEGEYSIDDVINILKNQLKYLSILGINYRVFCNNTSKAERETIISRLGEIQQWIDHLNNNVGGSYTSNHIKKIIQNIENIRNITRYFYIPLNKEFTYLEDVSNRILNIENNLNEQEDKTDKLDENLIDIEKQVKTITEYSKESNTKKLQLDENYQKIEESRKNILEIQKSCISNQENIENICKKTKTFYDEIDKRKKELEEQHNQTTEYNANLEKYKAERDELKKELEALIKQSEEVLGYSTGAGLSKSFHEKYKELKKNNVVLWIILGFIFLGGGIYLGIWILNNEDKVGIESVIGRFLLVPVLLSMTWFCLSQYVRQKNLAEDYSYKSVLVKSLVGFSKQLSDEGSNDEYKFYIKSVLEEILQDPLRKRNFNKRQYNIKNPSDFKA